MEGVSKLSDGFVLQVSNKLSQVRTGRVRSGPGQARRGQVRSGQVRTGQVRTCQVRMGQVRTGQVRNGKVWSTSEASRTKRKTLTWDLSMALLSPTSSFITLKHLCKYYDPFFPESSGDFFKNKHDHA